MGFASCAAVIGLAVAYALYTLLLASPAESTTAGVFDWSGLAADFLDCSIGPQWWLVASRLASFCLGAFTLWRVYLDPVPFEVRYDGSVYRMVRTGRWSTFTLWHFSVIVAYFALTLVLTFWAPAGTKVADRLAFVCLVLFSIVHPVSILVSSVCTFILLPTAANMNMEATVARMTRWPALVLHVANVFMMQVELLLTNPPLRPQFFAFTVLFGAAYAVFSWYWFARTGVFYYFFLDYRKPIAPLLYFGLISACGIFYAIGNSINQFAHLWGTPSQTYPIIMFATMLICRIRAPPLKRDRKSAVAASGEVSGAISPRSSGSGYSPSVDQQLLDGDEDSYDDIEDDNYFEDEFPKVSMIAPPKGNKEERFWSISLEGSETTVHFGRVGYAGRRLVKDHPSEADAQRFYTKMIYTTKSRGYFFEQ